MLTRRLLFPTLAAGAMAARVARADIPALGRGRAQGRCGHLVHRPYRRRNGATHRRPVRADLSRHQGQPDPHHRTGRLPAAAAGHQERHRQLRRVQLHRPWPRRRARGGRQVPQMDARRRRVAAAAIPRPRLRRHLLRHPVRAGAADLPHRPGQAGRGAAAWPDFLDPKWRNQVAVGHPAYSGTVGTWVLTMRKLYGWEYFEKLEANKPLIGRSVNDAVGVVNSGERIVAVGPMGLSQVQAVARQPDRPRLPVRRRRDHRLALGGDGQCAAPERRPAVCRVPAQRAARQAVGRGASRAGADRHARWRRATVRCRT